MNNQFLFWWIRTSFNRNRLMQFGVPFSFYCKMHFLRPSTSLSLSDPSSPSCSSSFFACKFITVVLRFSRTQNRYRERSNLCGTSRRRFRNDRCYVDWSLCTLQSETALSLPFLQLVVCSKPFFCRVHNARQGYAWVRVDEVSLDDLGQSESCPHLSHRSKQLVLLSPHQRGRLEMHLKCSFVMEW